LHVVTSNLHRHSGAERVEGEESPHFAIVAFAFLVVIPEGIDCCGCSVVAVVVPDYAYDFSPAKKYQKNLGLGPDLFFESAYSATIT
jgi:hypothetical protein